MTDMGKHTPVHVHWHVASGLSGYGPNADTDVWARTPAELADLIREELVFWIDYEIQSAHAYATPSPEPDYRSAWLLLQHADELDLLRANLNPERAKAPLFRSHTTGRPDPALWDAEVHRVTAAFPVDVNEGRSRVYVWECTEDCPEDD